MKLCVDLGATNVKSSLISDGKIIRSALTPTITDRGIEGVTESLRKSIDKLMNGDVSAVCISSAGTIDSAEGKVIYATDNLPGYTGFEIVRWVKECYGVPCAALNDGHAALLGEIFLDPALRESRTAMLTLGSGVGGAYAVRGKIKADESNDYARFGHLPVEKDGVLCNCGRRGCAEQYLSGRAINRMAAKEGIGADKLFEEYASGNPIAQKIVARLREYLCVLLREVEKTSPFDVCILGGGVTDGMKETFDAFIAGIPCDIRRAKAGNAAGMLGAYYFGKDL